VYFEVILGVVSLGAPYRVVDFRAVSSENSFFDHQKMQTAHVGGSLTFFLVELSVILN